MQTPRAAKFFAFRGFLHLKGFEILLDSTRDVRFAMFDWITYTDANQEIRIMILTQV